LSFSMLWTCALLLSLLSHLFSRLSSEPKGVILAVVPEWDTLLLIEQANLIKWSIDRLIVAATRRDAIWDCPGRKNGPIEDDEARAEGNSITWNGPLRSKIKALPDCR
jgi:hypothetical protein